MTSCASVRDDGELAQLSRAEPQSPHEQSPFQDGWLDLAYPRVDHLSSVSSKTSHRSYGGKLPPFLVPADQRGAPCADLERTDGILDRLVHNAHRIEMRGDSMRKNRSKANT